jgi:hypothetical protein
MLKFVYMFSKSSVSALKMVYKHDDANEDPSTYRLSVPNTEPKHDPPHVHLHPICAGICLWIWRAKYLYSCIGARPKSIFAPNFREL